jgi:hypothetical protein
LSAGSSATVTNVGTSAAAVFDFGIPAGPQGSADSGTLTTKGDLLTRTSSALTRLAVGGTDGHVLTVDSTTSEGIKWAAGGGGGGATDDDQNILAVQVFS